ncbi:fimbrillin family protein [Segatella paludivivens]|uniref:fimbrillin family protein n=1 Tax=Segatella paludivivens TaxID=185294 RepID=UPI0003AAB429|nr:fimbrillin family protein [Segatella paludivivens]
MGKKSLRDINVSLLLLIIISMFCSCAADMNMLNGNNNNQINFSVSVPVWKNADSLSSSKTSRATPITDTSFGADKNFNLIADQNDGAGNYSTLIDKESVSFTNNIWQTTPSHYYWSGTANKTMNFYAYYPTSISGNISHTAGASPTLSYTVPNDAVNQLDIMTATANNINGNTNSSTPLTFNHIFAAVKFAVGTNGLPSGTIKSISISGIYNSGTYTFGSGWSNVTGSNTFVISPSTVITGTSGANITSDTYTLMMIPQIFTSATITLTYNTGTSYKQIISGNWTAGATYTYNLSKPVNVGDYYYSDGTWGTIAEHTNSTAKPIAVIFSNSTSAIDKGYGWKHGYAIALQYAYKGTLNWSSSTYANTLEMGQTYTDISSVESDLEGYTHTKTIITKSTNLSTDYPTFYYAYNYNNTVVPPTNSSRWFLASIGQYHLFSINICKIPTSTYYLSSTFISSGWAWARNDNGAFNSSFLARDNFNACLTTAENAGASVDKVLCGSSDYPDWVDSWYNSSSEYSATNPYFLLFGAGGDLMYDHRRTKNNTTDNLRVCIRPVIAF